MKIYMLLIALALLIMAADAKYSPALELESGANITLSSGYVTMLPSPSYYRDASTKGYVDNRTNIISVKDYGAKGDNSTDDTTAFVNAIAAIDALAATYPGINSMATLYIPPGKYRITPGNLEVRCNVYGPQAHLIARTNAQDALIKVRGCLYKTIELGGLFGYAGAYPDNLVPSYPHKTNGIELAADATFATVANCHIKIPIIASMSYGILLDGDEHSSHLVSNTFEVAEIYNCTSGIDLIAKSYQVEGNIFKIGYMGYNTFNVMAGVSDTGSTTYVQTNYFDIYAMELHNFYGQWGVIFRGAKVANNVVDIKSIYFSAPNTLYILYTYGEASDGAQRNLFKLPECNWTATSIGSTKGNKVMTFGGYGRTTSVFSTSGDSVIYGTAAPTAGDWEKGAICFNSNPSAGNAAFWMCTTAGTPGTWKAGGTLAS